MRKAYNNKVDIVKRYNIEVTLFNRKETDRQITFRTLGNSDFGNLNEFRFRAIGGTIKYCFNICLETIVPFTTLYNRYETLKNKHLQNSLYKNIVGTPYTNLGTDRAFGSCIDVEVPLKQDVREGKNYEEIERETNQELEQQTYFMLTKLKMFITNIEVTI